MSASVGLNEGVPAQVRKHQLLRNSADAVNNQLGSTFSAQQNSTTNRSRRRAKTVPSGTTEPPSHALNHSALQRQGSVSKPAGHQPTVFESGVSLFDVAPGHNRQPRLSAKRHQPGYDAALGDKPSSVDPPQRRPSNADRERHQTRPQKAGWPAARTRTVEPQHLSVRQSALANPTESGGERNERSAEYTEGNDEATNESSTKQALGERQRSPSLPRGNRRSGLKRKLARLEPNAGPFEGVSERSPTRASQPTVDRTRSPSTKEPDPRPPKPGRKPGVLCVNNKHDPRLVENGGNRRLGSPGQCIAKGFGAGLHQTIAPGGKEAFIKQFDAPYEKIINLDALLWYKNSPPPRGRFRATLPMAFQKGWGAGSAALARKLKAAERHGASL